MALKWGSNTISETTGVIKYNGANVTKVVYNGTTVWQKRTQATQTLGDHTYQARTGDNVGDWRYNWITGPTYTLTNAGIITSINMNKWDSEARGRLYASNNKSNWTLLLDGFSHTNTNAVAISNTSTWKYIRLDMKGITGQEWVEPAGIYAWSIVTGFKVTYYH